MSCPLSADSRPAPSSLPVPPAPSVLSWPGAQGILTAADSSTASPGSPCTLTVWPLGAPSRPVLAGRSAACSEHSGPHYLQRKSIPLPPSSWSLRRGGIWQSQRRALSTGGSWPATLLCPDGPGGSGAWWSLGCPHLRGAPCSEPQSPVKWE